MCPPCLHVSCASTGIFDISNTEFPIMYKLVNIGQDVSAMCCMYRGLGLPALVRVVDPEQVLILIL